MLNRYMAIKAEMQKLEEELDQIKVALYMKADFGSKKSCSFELDGYKIKIQQKENIKVDQDLASKKPELFKAKYELNTKVELTDEERAYVNKCITTSVGKPQFVVERL